MSEVLTENEAEARVAGIAFKIGPPSVVGAELEWHVHDSADRSASVPPARTWAALDAMDPLPGRSALTMEPGGQIELSSQPASDVSRSVALLRTDAQHLAGALSTAGLVLDGSGLDATREPRRHLEEPRYVAMERAFDASGPDGRVMMCATAAVQVSLDAGDESRGSDGIHTRWHTAHSIGPVLVAAFANSPLEQGRRTGWRSSRQRAWLQMDPTRTIPVHQHGQHDPRDAWARYSLDALVLMIRREGGDWPVPTGLTFREWLRGEGPGRPTIDDLDYHLTTLFPPVRPKGFLELRMVDQQHGDDWAVVVAVASALLDDPKASDAARDATECVADRWVAAARDGLSDPPLARAAQSCFAAALDAMPRMRVDAQTRALVEDFVERYVARGRCPADDRTESVAC